MFNRSRQFVVNGGIFRNDFSRYGISGVEHLHHAIAVGAIHDSNERYDAPKCHPDTRIAVLGDVMGWVASTKKFSQILWLNGPAGAGKSSIAQTICESCEASGQLAASFFFSRTAPDRNNPSQLFSTIAYQLAIINPDFKRILEGIIESDPSIVDKKFDVQLQKLISGPLKEVSLESFLSKVIVIDGLDECSDGGIQAHILHLIGTLVRLFPLGFLITSRPEPFICDTFNTKRLIFVSQPISLSSFEGIDHDIRTFLQSGFARILNDPQHRHTMGFVSRPWPSAGVIDTLVKNSSRQFIYAATVMKFIDTPDSSPATLLDVVLGIKPSHDVSPLSELDKLYAEILSRVRLPRRTMEVVGYILAIQRLSSSLHAEKFWGYRPMHISVIGSILKNTRRLFLLLDQLLSLASGEAYASLHGLHSLISVPATKSFRRVSQIQFHHASFSDFLLDSRRSDERHFIDIGAVHARITGSCFNLMSDFPSSFKHPEKYVGWIYAVLLWYEHCSKASGQLDLDFMIDIRKFDFSSHWVRVAVANCSFIDWMDFNEALSILGLNRKDAMNTFAYLYYGRLGWFSPDEDHIINRACNTLQKSPHSHCQEICQFLHTALDAIFFEHLSRFQDHQKLMLMLGLLQCTNNKLPKLLIYEIFGRQAHGVYEYGNSNEFIQGFTTTCPYSPPTDYVIITIMAFRTFLDDPRRSGRYHVSSDIHTLAMKHIIDCAQSIKRYYIDRRVGWDVYSTSWMVNLKRTLPSQTLLKSIEAATDVYRSLEQPNTLTCEKRQSTPSSPHMLVSEWLKGFHDPPIELIHVWETMNILGPFIRVVVPAIRDPPASSQHQRFSISQHLAGPTEWYNLGRF